MKKMTQFRYCGEKNDNSTCNISELKNGDLFDGYSQITQLGIQGEPGTRFVLNGGDYPIILGETGIYEIDLEDRGFIHSISFSTGTTVFNKYKNGSTLLIDIVYEGGA